MIEIMAACGPAMMILALLYYASELQKSLAWRIDYAIHQLFDVENALAATRREMEELRFVQLVRYKEERRTTARVRAMRRAVYRGGTWGKRGRVRKTVRRSSGTLA